MSLQIKSVLKLRVDLALICQHQNFSTSSSYSRSAEFTRPLDGKLATLSTGKIQIVSQKHLMFTQHFKTM